MLYQTVHLCNFIVNMVTVIKFQTFSLSVIKFRTGTHKMLNRIANREDPGQTASSSVRNIRKFTV